MTALRAKDGTEVWKTYTIREKPKEIEKGPDTCRNLGTVRRGRMGIADTGCQARLALHHDR